MPSSNGGYSSDGSISSMYNNYSKLKTRRRFSDLFKAVGPKIKKSASLSPRELPSLVQHFETETVPNPTLPRLRPRHAPEPRPSPKFPRETETIPNHPTPPGRGRTPAPRALVRSQACPHARACPQSYAGRPTRPRSCSIPGTSLPPFLSVSPIPGLLQRPSPPQGLLQSLHLLLSSSPNPVTVTRKYPLPHTTALISTSSRCSSTVGHI
jgi:hypothetical protein